MKFLHKFWPWKAIDELEAQVSRLNVQLAEEKAHHLSTKAENHAIKGELKVHQERAAKNQKHMQKMANIIALKGGIIGLLLFFLCVPGFAQPIQRNPVTTNTLGTPLNNTYFLGWDSLLLKPAWLVPAGTGGGTNFWDYNGSFIFPHFVTGVSNANNFYNLGGDISQNATNFTLLVGGNDTNNDNLHASNNTNFTLLVGSNDTNNDNLHAANNTNFSLLIGANATNNDANSTNFALLIGVNGTNNGTVVSNGVVAHTVQIQGNANQIVSSTATAQPLSGNPSTTLSIKDGAMLTNIDLEGVTTISSAVITNLVWTNAASGNWGYLTVTSTNTQLVNIGTNGSGGFLTYHFGNGVTSNEFRYFNTAGQQVFAMQTNGAVQIGTNNQVAIDASGNMTAPNLSQYRAFDPVTRKHRPSLSSIVRPSGTTTFISLGDTAGSIGSAANYPPTNSSPHSIGNQSAGVGNMGMSGNLIFYDTNDVTISMVFRLDGNTSSNQIWAMAYNNPGVATANPSAASMAGSFGFRYVSTNGVDTSWACYSNDGITTKTNYTGVACTAGTWTAVLEKTGTNIVYWLNGTRYATNNYKPSTGSKMGWMIQNRNEDSAATCGIAFFAEDTELAWP